MAARREDTTKDSRKMGYTRPHVERMEELALPDDCIHIEITKEMAKAATAADFTCDNELWVCALDAEGVRCTSCKKVKVV